MILVTDTGPLNYLILIGEEAVLPKLFTSIFIPDAVAFELRQIGAPARVRDWMNSSAQWLRVRNPAGVLQASADLTCADHAVIRLASELKAILLLDDRRARALAVSDGIQTIGTIGVLELASIKGLLDLPEALRKLRDTNHRHPYVLIEDALRRFEIRKKGNNAGH